MTMRDSPASYGAVSRLNHWIGALFVLLMLGIGLYFGALPRGEEKRFWRGLHVAFGTIAILLLLFRVFWSMRSSAPPALPQKPVLQLLAKTVHRLLLLGIVILVLTGPLSMWSGGRSFGIFDLLQIPSPFPPFKSYKDLLEQIHSVVAYAMMGLIGLHLLGVLKHQFIDRDNILSRKTGRSRK